MKNYATKEETIFKNTNNRVFCVNTPRAAGFDVYLDFSGEHILLNHQRHNAMLYALLKDGISLGQLYRWRTNDLSSIKKFLGISFMHDRMLSKTEHSVKQLTKAIDACINDMQRNKNIKSVENPKGFREMMPKADVECMLAA